MGESVESSRHAVEEVRALSFRDIAPVHVSVQDLSVDVNLRPSLSHRLAHFDALVKPGRPESKRLLNNVSAEMPQGSLTAVIGASGSGKTTLLNVLSSRIKDSGLVKTGACSFNNHPDMSSVSSAYLMQTDELQPALTIRETLRYAAQLRLPQSNGQNHQDAIVEEVIAELGLGECADTRIGDSGHKGCSGGEKRRTSLAVQLLVNPSVLFCDEPTTGLDSTSAHQLIRTLGQLARGGRTVVTTIHQPRSEIWELFDRVILLAKGNVLYSGPKDGCLAHFEALGHPLPPFVNPAEHLIDLAAFDTRSPELSTASGARVDRLQAAWNKQVMATSDVRKVHGSRAVARGVDSTACSMQPGKVSFHGQVRAQTARAIKSTVREPSGLTGSVVGTVAMAVVTGWIFSDLGDDGPGIRSRAGALYNAGVLQGYLFLLFEVYRLTLDIRVYDRERAEGVVGPLSFIVSRRLAHLFLEDIPMPLVFSLIYYFFCGFSHDAAQFFCFLAVMLLQHFIVVAFATLSVSMFRDFARASLVANINFTLQSMCCGFFVQSNQIPVYVRWLKYATYSWYTNGALVNNEFNAHTASPNGKFYACPYPEGAANPACQQYVGENIVASFGFPTRGWIWRPMVILVAFVVLLTILSWLLLSLSPTETQIHRRTNNRPDRLVCKDDLKRPLEHKKRAIAITLERYALTVTQRRLPWQKSRKISILHPVDMRFEPGVLNVIMGSSGCGKTSLLNMMARRCESGIFDRWHATGTMLIDGSVPSGDVVRSMIAYVCQDDSGLLPTLTVRETLYFSAELRLPSWLSREDKIQRAESVLLKLGLRDCADVLVGNDSVKGISGGEKRRVSIAVQILTDPRIILLDEPTSGLDAFTASTIIDLLESLADEGRTLIFTMHQSRSDIFARFGNLLLLARNGCPVYGGEAKEMLPYFSKLGHDCPRNMNPADFALDLITPGLQPSTEEASIGPGARSLVESWTSCDQPSPARTANHVLLPAELGSLQRSVTPFHRSFPLLLRRSVKNFRRDGNAILARVYQTVSFAVVVTLFFAPLKNDYEAIQTRFGFIQEFLGLYFVGMLCNLAVYPAERDVFYREHDDGAYGVEAFFLQYTLLELPFEIVTCLIFAVLTDLAAFLPRTVEVFFVVFFNAFCIVSCGESVGIIFNTLFVSTGFAVNVASSFLSISLLMAGILSTGLDSFLKGVNHLSPAKWSIQSLAPYTIREVTFTCSSAQRGPDGQCPITTGTQALDLYNLNTDGSVELLALGICTLAYRLVAYLLLKAVKTQWKGSWRRIAHHSSLRRLSAPSSAKLSRRRPDVI